MVFHLCRGYYQDVKEEEPWRQETPKTAGTQIALLIYYSMALCTFQLYARSLLINLYFITTDKKTPIPE
jgi:hypothetical protein